MAKAALYHFSAPGPPRQWAISRLWFNSLQRLVTPNMAALNKQVINNEARDNQKCASVRFVSGYHLFFFCQAHFRDLEKSIFFESCIFKPVACSAQKPEMVLAIGQEWQKTQLVDNQSLNNIETIFVSKSQHFACWPVPEEVHPALRRPFALARGDNGCRGAAEQCATPSSPPLQMLCCCILWFIFAAPFQPHCKWSSQLYPSLNPNPNCNPKPSWGWTIGSFAPAIIQTKYFSQPPSLQPLFSFRNPTATLLLWEYWPFFLSTHTLNMGSEVLPDLH